MTKANPKEYLRFQPDSSNSTGFISFLHTYFSNDLLISASSSESCCPPTNIFQKESFWRSDNIASSSFTVSFLKFLFRLDAFSALACKHGQCIKDIDIYGSINNSKPERICSFRGNYASFDNKNTKIDCPTRKLYNNITVVNPSPNALHDNHFALYQFEIFVRVDPNILILCL